MKFIELNKKRHAVKHFNEKEVDYKDIRTAIEIATLAPSAHNIQPWKFVVVKDAKDSVIDVVFGGNKDQVKEAQYVIAIFSDTDLAKRSRKIGRIGVKNLSEAQLERFMTFYPKMFESFTSEQTSDYLALNSGLVAMNLSFALTDQGIASNIMLGFDKSQVNDLLDIDKRFRPELLITVGYSDEKVEPSYRLPVDEIIEKR